jgi:VWFA-related protein
MSGAGGPLGRAVLVVCLATVVVTGGPASARQSTGQAQSPPPASDQRPVFRGAANLVYVDVYPKRDGRFVDGLRPADFQVFEDGVPQKVETFELIQFARHTPDEQRRDPSSREEGDQLAADPRNRVFIVYLDLFHVSIEGSRRGSPPLADFLNAVIGPSDVFGVLTPEIPVSSMVFGRRSDWLETQLREVWHWGEQERVRGQLLLRTPAEEFLQTCLPSDPQPGRRADFGNVLVRLHREDLLMTSLENLVMRLGALKDERKNVLFLSEGWVPRGPRPELLKEINQPVPRIGVGPDGRLGTGNRAAGRDVTGCDREIGRLASLDFRTRFDAMLTAASRANVSFYPIDVDGLWELGGGQINTLRDMAAATDGLAVLYTNDLAAGFRRVADDLQAYYLLGYYSTNLALDGRFRKIEVKVPQPGVSLTARRGYLAPDEAMLRAAEAAAARAAAAPAVPIGVTEALESLVRLRTDAALHGHGIRTSSGLSVAIELSPRELTTGRWSKGGEVSLTVTSTAGGLARDVTVGLPAGARSLAASVPLEGGDRGPWRVRAQARAGSQLIEQTFEIGPPADDVVGDARWFRGASAASAPLRPAAEPAFRRAERLRLEWATTGPLDSRSARLLDRRGAPLAASVPVAEGERDGQPIVVVELALAALAEGDYVIELTAARGGATTKRMVAFRVTR